MVFLADVFVPCEACGGTRFKPEVLDIRIKGQSIHDVLQWSVDDAINRFRHQPGLGTALWQLQQIWSGLPSTGPAGDHAVGRRSQRLKIARELLSAGQEVG